MSKPIQLTAAAVAVSAALAAFSAPAHAGVSDDAIEALKAQIQDLDQKIRILQRQQEIDKEDAAAKAKTAAVPVFDSKGVGIKSGDNDFRLKGYVQGDSRFYSNNSPINDTFQIRRLRLIFTGTFGKYYNFQLEPSFDAGVAALQNAWVEGAFTDYFKLRFGKFKVPFGLERLQSSANNSFVETAFTTQLTPNYEVGAQVGGTLFGNTDYQLAVFNGAALDNGSADTDLNDNKEWVARVFSKPFKNTDIDALKGLGLGIAYASGEVQTALAPYGYRPIGQQAGVITPAAVPLVTYLGTFAGDKDVQRLSPQAYWYYGPFGVLTEYVQVKENLVRTATPALGGVNQRDITNHAWQVLGNWVVTGGNASYNGVVPKKSFNWTTGDLGEIELVARFSALNIDGDTFAGSTAAVTAAQVAATQFASHAVSVSDARDLGLGLNWYLTPNVKVQTSYDRTQFSGGAAGGADRADERVFFTRVQLAY